MRTFDAIEHDQGLTPEQAARTNAAFARIICMNIDQLAEHAHRTRDQNLIEQFVSGYQGFAFRLAGHNI